MKKGVLVLFSFLMTSLSAWSLNYCQTAAFGYGKSATGGAGGAVKTVASSSELSSALKASGKSIIVITKSFTVSSMIKVKATDKTLMALPGVSITSDQQNSDKSGILYFSSGSKNIILRNLTLIGPGAYDCDGNDLLCFDGVTNAWVDHCDFQDGCDGNFDNKGNTDNVTVSWCRFHYLKTPKSGGSGGADDHRFTNLLGSSSSDKPADGTYNMTWAYCWWDSGCKERMVRGRNASLHFLNCYWNSSVANYYIGPENLDAYLEGCYIEGKPGKSSIFKSYGGKNGLTCKDCYSKNGLPTATGRTVVIPTYSYEVVSYTEAKSMVSNTSCGAGATLTVTTAGVVSSSCDGDTPQPQAAPTLNDPTNKSQTVTAGTAIAAITFTASGTATGISVSNLPAGLTSKKDGLSITISGTPTATGTYTVTATNASGATVTTQGTITVGTTPQPEEDPEVNNPANKSQTVIAGAAITPITFTASGTANSISVSTLPAGLTSKKDGLNLTISGTPTVSGSYTITVKNATGATVEEGGYITVNPKQDPVDPVTPTDIVQNSTWWNFSDVDFKALSGDLKQSSAIRQFHIQATEEDKMKANESSKKYDGIQFSYRLQMVGEGSVDRHFWFDVKGACTIDIYMLASNSSATYKMNIATGAFGTVAQTFNVPGSAIAKYTYSYTGSQATRIYLYPSDGGINVYGVRLTYASAPQPEADPTLNDPANKSQTVTAGTAIAAITFTAGGTATDISVSNLPAGLTSKKDGLSITISGTPTATGTYTVTATNAGGATVTAQGTITVNSTPGPQPSTHEFTWNMSDPAFAALAGSITSTTTVDGLTIVAKSDGTLTIDEQEMKYGFAEGDTVTFVTRLKTGGSGKADCRHLKFDVTGDCIIEVWAKSSSSSDDRTINIYTNSLDSKNQIGTLPAPKGDLTKQSFTYTGGPATIVMGSASSGINFYAINIVYPSVPSGLYDVLVAPAVGKMIHNGQVRIFRHGHLFDMHGKMLK
ncbi:MAG: hypothetical protein MJZ64_07865 [Paludibacteraceae bacterium]|nr:hypothetical protein [Paludibacteraceae bacterium]